MDLPLPLPANPIDALQEVIRVFEDRDDGLDAADCAELAERYRAAIQEMERNGDIVFIDDKLAVHRPFVGKAAADQIGKTGRLQFAWFQRFPGHLELAGTPLWIEVDDSKDLGALPFQLKGHGAPRGYARLAGAKADAQERAEELVELGLLDLPHSNPT